MHLEDKLFFALFIVIALVLAALVISGVIYYLSPEFTLKKSEWTCTASHQETTTTIQYIGNTPIFIPTTHTICDVYTRSPS